MEDLPLFRRCSTQHHFLFAPLTPVWTSGQLMALTLLVSQLFSVSSLLGEAESGRSWWKALLYCLCILLCVESLLKQPRLGALLLPFTPNCFVPDFISIRWLLHLPLLHVVGGLWFWGDAVGGGRGFNWSLEIVLLSCLYDGHVSIFELLHVLKMLRTAVLKERSFCCCGSATKWLFEESD